MKKYIFTSKAFMGEAMTLYGDDGRLLLIDFTNCDMDDSQISYFNKQLPVLDPHYLEKFFPDSKMTVIEDNITVTFDQFWSKYDLKRNKIRVEKLWKRLSKADQVKAFFGLNMYHRFLMLNQWRTKAAPDTYLRDRYWENEWK